MSFLSERVKVGLSQAKVADAIGVTDSAVCQWETGKTVPRAPILVKLAALYGCTIDQLLTADNELPKN